MTQFTEAVLQNLIYFSTAVIALYYAFMFLKITLRIVKLGPTSIVRAAKSGYKSSIWWNASFEGDSGTSPTRAATEGVSSRTKLSLRQIKKSRAIVVLEKAPTKFGLF